MLFVYLFYYLSAWCGCWFVVDIRRFIYKFLNVCPFDYTAVGEVGRLARKPVNHTSWMAVVTPTDRPQSLFNRTFLWRCLCCHFALLTFLLV